VFNPQVFYQTLFGRLPKGERNQSLMDIADQFGVFDESTRNRLKFMSEQLMRVQAADAAGKLKDPDFMAEAGPIVDFYVGVLGSAAGTATFKAVGGTGAGSISAAGVGARELRKYMLELPAVSKLRAIDLIFTDPPLVAALMQKPTTVEGKTRQSQKIIQMLNDKLFNSKISMAPYVTRETFEEEDRGTSAPYRGFPGLPVNTESDARQRREQFQQQQREIIQQQQPTPPLRPPQLPTQGAGAATSPGPHASAAPQRPPLQSSGPVDRARFAALFPEDRELMGIASLMG
jgi:hypothetical protein